MTKYTLIAVLSPLCDMHQLCYTCVKHAPLTADWACHLSITPLTSLCGVRIPGDGVGCRGYNGISQFNGASVPNTARTLPGLHGPPALSVMRTNCK